VKKHDGAT
jgi:hypothetical protein